MAIKYMRTTVTLLAVAVLGGCATMPTGPSVLVLPAAGKPLEKFQEDETICRQWAEQQTGLPPGRTANRSTASGAAVGTVLGAGGGALIGAASGHPGTGAAIGAGTGLLVGTAAGASSGERYGSEGQRRYDYAYVQCMYSKGNQIPGRVYQYRLREATPPPPPPNRKGTVPPPDYAPGSAPR